MPYINLRLIGNLTKEQKTKIVEEFSETLERVAGKSKDYTYVVIDEVPAENWGHKGKLFG